jgi:hypothetical protein
MSDALWEVDKNPLVQPRHTLDEQAQAAWNQVLAVMRMLDDMTMEGARIRLSRMAAAPDVDPRQEMVRALAAMAGRILAKAKVVDP